MPSYNPVAQLRCLDGASPGFHDLLYDILYGEEYNQCLPNLDGGDALWLVGYLDKALDILDPSSLAFRKCLRELRSICGARAMLPESYTILSYLNVNPDPFTQGGFGDVYEGTLNGSRVCIKRVRVYTEYGPQKAAKTFCQEAVMWKRLIHPNILPLLGVTVNPFQLISNWMPGGDLPNYLRRNPGADRLGLLSDVAEGLCYLHSCNVVHGDLKGPNILVDDSDHARIADFGLAKVTQNLASIRSASLQHGFTPRWTAPEVLGGGGCSKEADVFSFAMVTIEVFTGAAPFSDYQSVTAVLTIMQGGRPSRPTHPIFTDGLWTLTQRCWNHLSHLRPEASEVLRILLTTDPPAWKRLINCPLSIHERIFLIDSIFSDSDQVEVVGRLFGNDAQTFIDLVHEALGDLPPETRRGCLHYLHWICGRRSMLPRSSTIPLCYDPAGTPLHHGGLGDLWKGQYDGRDVAAKVLKVYRTGDLKQTRKRFCREVVTWKALRHPNVLALLGATMEEDRLVMVSNWMRNGNINEFVKAHADVNRLELLAGAARGLIYMHDLGIIHGSLKGANVLIDSNGRARLTGSGLLTTTSEQSTVAPPPMVGSTVRWASPELLYPDSFGLKSDRPTRQSDCYALGMVVYEVVGGRAPFSHLDDTTVMRRIKEGSRPERPQGEFTDALWAVLELCWKHRPRDRISAKSILLGLEGAPLSLRPVDEIVETDSDGQSDTTASESGTIGPDVAHGADGLPVPQHRHLKYGWVGDWLVRIARRIVNAATRQLHDL